VKAGELSEDGGLSAGTFMAAECLFGHGFLVL